MNKYFNTGSLQLQSWLIRVGSENWTFSKNLKSLVARQPGRHPHRPPTILQYRRQLGAGNARDKNDIQKWNELTTKAPLNRGVVQLASRNPMEPSLYSRNETNRYPRGYQHDNEFKSFSNYSSIMKQSATMILQRWWILVNCAHIIPLHVPIRRSPIAHCPRLSFMCFDFAVVSPKISTRI